MLREHVEQPELDDPTTGSFREVLKQEALGHSQIDIRLSRKLSEESIRTELCEGPILDSPQRPKTPEQEDSKCSDRAELIERIKRGESPTWVPNRHVSSETLGYASHSRYTRALTPSVARIALPTAHLPLSHRKP